MSLKFQLKSAIFTLRMTSCPLTFEQESERGQGVRRLHYTKPRNKISQWQKPGSKQDWRCFHNLRKAVNVPKQHPPQCYIQTIMQRGKPSVWYSPTWNASSPRQPCLKADPRDYMTSLQWAPGRLKTAWVSVYGIMLIVSEKNNQLSNHIWHASACLPRKQVHISLPY